MSLQYAQTAHVVDIKLVCEFDFLVVQQIFRICDVLQLQV